MGRLPAQWAGRVINDRFPYEFSAELALATGAAATQFPNSAFLHSIDKPFEIHRMIPRVVANDGSSVPIEPQPDMELLLMLIRLELTNLGINQIMTKGPTRLGALVKGSSERTWEWAEPQTLAKGHELVATIQALTFPTFSPAVTTLTTILTFEGFLLQVAPPSDVR